MLTEKDKRFFKIACCSFPNYIHIKPEIEDSNLDALIIHMRDLKKEAPDNKLIKAASARLDKILEERWEKQLNSQNNKLTYVS